ncbi:MAG: hypothetical protein IPK58_19130 [Acidobacteria bacterium]|nr:hypothetical protein [Acidobacteriota bacterium]
MPSKVDIANAYRDKHCRRSGEQDGYIFTKAAVTIAISTVSQKCRCQLSWKLGDSHECLVPVGIVMMMVWVSIASAQSALTTISMIEIDGQEIKTKYRVFFQLNDKWIRAKQTKSGFDPN